MTVSRILFASNPRADDVSAFIAEAAGLIKARLEVDVTVDPRVPMDIGTLAAKCRNLELSFRRRAHHRLPDGGGVDLYAVFGRVEDHPPVYLGNEVREADGRVIAQRIRSPEAAVAFRQAATAGARHEKGANLFMANWCDETVIDRLTAKALVVGAMPSDQVAGVAYRLSWYVKEHRAGPGRVDLRPALPAICAALDAAAVAAGEGPVRAIVSAPELAAITVAVNLVGTEGGVIRLRAALRAAGVPIVPAPGEGEKEGGYRAALLRAARGCSATGVETEATVPAGAGA